MGGSKKKSIKGAEKRGKVGEIEKDENPTPQEKGKKSRPALPPVRGKSFPSTLKKKKEKTKFSSWEGGGRGGRGNQPPDERKKRKGSYI